MPTSDSLLGSNMVQCITMQVMFRSRVNVFHSCVNVFRSSVGMFYSRVNVLHLRVNVFHSRVTVFRSSVAHTARFPQSGKIWM
jgi:hypothetical protein